MKDKKGVNAKGSRGWEERGGLEKGETIIRLYCIRKQSLFNKGKRKEKD